MIPCVAWATFGGLLAVPLVAQAADTFRPLTTVAGPQGMARPVDFAADGRLTFSILPEGGGAEQSIVVPVADLVAWGAPEEYGRGTYVVTVDEGVLAAERVGVAGDALDVLSPLFESRELPLARVRGVVFHPPAARAARDRLFRRLAQSREGDRDRLLLGGGDEVPGTLTSLDSRHAVLNTAVGEAKIELGRTSAVLFNPALADEPKFPPVRVVVGLADGSLIAAASISGGERVRLTPLVVAGESVDDERLWEVDRSEIVFLQTFGGSATYLSDVEPLGYKHVPYLELARDYRLDRSPGDGDLRAGGQRYLKGVGMFSTSRLTFPLAADRRRFAAEIAIDDETGGRGSVMMRVFVDAEERFRSEVVYGGAAPQPIEVDVAGGGSISLVVDFAEEADVLDHAVWLNARLLP